MAAELKRIQQSIVGFMDIGTNAARLLLVRFHPNGSFTVVRRERETIRLGEGEFKDGRLHPEAIARCVLVCRHFAELARSYNADRIIAVATSASREAANRDRLLATIRKQARIDLQVISGKEEARLIYLGLSSGIEMGDRKAVFIDIGGGSTEVIVGDRRKHLYLDSLKLGAIRLSNLFFKPDESGPVAPERYEQIKAHVRDTAIRVLEQVRKHPFTMGVGSSGTIINLAQIASRMFFNRPLGREGLLRHDHLRQVVERLCELNLEDRRKVPGINPERADIIIPGAAIIDTLMEELKLEELHISDRGLRDGLLVDYLTQHSPDRKLKSMSIRQRSVLMLGRRFDFDEVHARKVEKLAMELFDSAREIGLITLAEPERELLAHSALLHDIGVFLSFDNHHAHSYYLIRNADLLGFTQNEIDLMANIARFHRKGYPNIDHPEYSALDPGGRQRVLVLSLLLRLAESLDRSHKGIIHHARFANADRKKVELVLDTKESDCPLELWGVNTHLKTFKKTFGKKLAITLRAAKKKRKLTQN